MPIRAPHSGGGRGVVRHVFILVYPTWTMATQPEQGTDATRRASDRRSNLVLRSLIDEMLERVRELNRNSTVWTPEDRARAEAELDSIMARVRRIAARRFA